jgi:hypothetical protein
MASGCAAEDGSHRHFGHAYWQPIGDDWMLPSATRHAFGLAGGHMALPIG